MELGREGVREKNIYLYSLQMNNPISTNENLRIKFTKTNAIEICFSDHAFCRCLAVYVMAISIIAALVNIVYLVIDSLTWWYEPWWSVLMWLGVSEGITAIILR